MTKHRKPEAWTADILEAASEIVDADGYANLTMDAVATRVGLSKGGIYRFFASKRDLVSALLDRAYFHSMDFDVDEVVAWNLPIDETFVRVVIDKPTEDTAQAEREDRIWLQIIPQALRDPELAGRYRTVTSSFETKCLALANKLLERDGIELDPPSRRALHEAVQMGIILRDGLAVRTTVSTVAEAAEVGRRYVRMTLKHVLGARHA
jgi:AcrR family transcriptional regulator